MAISTIDSDLHVNGMVSFTNASLPAGVVTNSTVATTAAIAVTKSNHLIKVGTNFGIEVDTAPGTDTTYTFCVYVASGAATIRQFKACILDVGSQNNTFDFDFDLQYSTKGNETLTNAGSSPMVCIDSDIADNTPVAGSLTTTSLAEGASLVIKLVTPGTITGTHGIFAWVELSEGAN